MESLGRNIHLTVQFFKAPFLCLPFFLDFIDDDICNIIIYAEDTTVYSKCDQTSDVRQ